MLRTNAAVRGMRHWITRRTALGGFAATHASFQILSMPLSSHRRRRQPVYAEPRFGKCWHRSRSSLKSRPWAILAGPAARKHDFRYLQISRSRKARDSLPYRMRLLLTAWGGLSVAVVRQLSCRAE